MSDPLADLKRRAYARPQDDGAASEAQAELARLAEERHRAERGVDIDLPPVEPFRVAGARATVVLAVAAALALAAAVSTYLPPAGSLAVFDRPQSAGDFPTLWPLDDRYLANDSVRSLGVLKGVELFAFRMLDGDVCLSAQVDAGSATSCAPVIQFRRTGIDIGASFGSYIEGASFTASWGPNGGPAVTTQ